MKIQLLITLSVLACTQIAHAQYQQHSRFTLTGKITGRDTGIIILNYLANDGTGVEDTSHLKNGSFTFTGSINSPVPATLIGDVKLRDMDDPNITQVFLMPANMTITLRENSFDHAKLSGSVMQDDMDALKEQKMVNDQAMNNISQELKQLTTDQKAGTDAKVISIKRDSIYKIYVAYRNLNRKIDYSFIASHKASYLSPYLMNYYFGSRQLSLDSAEMFYNSFSAAVKNSRAGRSINKDITGRKNSAVGRMAPVFTKTDIDGNTIDLASFIGKRYIILDFWASCCVPSVWRLLI